MERALPTPPELPKEFLERAKADAEKSQPKAYVSRRFWARWLDLTVYAAVWWLGMYFSGRDIASAILNPWMLLSMYIPWFMLEAWLIHRFGATPGKWLMGLRVRNEDDSLLPLKASMWRAIRVLISGIGFGWQLLSPLCQVMSWFTTRRIGKPIWDYLGGHKVVAEPLNPLKIGALVFLFFCSIQLQMAVRWPHEKAIWLETYPESKDLIGDNEIWTLPVKKH